MEAQSRGKRRKVQDESSSVPHVLICLDDFKGTISSHSAGVAVEKQLHHLYGEAITTSVLSISDGGDGFLQALRAPLDLELVEERVIGPSGNLVDAQYGWSRKLDHLAVVEMAMASGLSKLSDPSVLEPMRATTYGTGQLIKAAYERGAKRIIVGLGGSATTDGGLGCLQALGLEIHYASSSGDHKEEEKYACGGVLSRVDRVVVPEAGMLPGVNIQLALDVTSPFVGPDGSTAVYSKQKGAKADQQMQLEEGMVHLARVYFGAFGKDVSALAGAGAAGGLAGGLMAAFSPDVFKGMEILDDLLGLTSAVQNADLVITGEGQYDAQTSRGKVVWYMQALARLCHTPIVVLCGSKKDVPEHIYQLVDVYDLETALESPASCLRGVVSLKAHQFPILGTLIPKI